MDIIDKLYYNDLRKRIRSLRSKGMWNKHKWDGGSRGDSMCSKCGAYQPGIGMIKPLPVWGCPVK